MASVQETLNQINSALHKAGKHYSSYGCKTVSWDDVQRGTDGGSLSCWGANITDTRLYAKDGRQLFTVRGDNWNERLGKVTADDLALIASHDSNSGFGDDGDDGDGGGCVGLKPITLREMLKNISNFGGYAGLKDTESIANDVLDKEISVRFQTTFLPVDKDERAALEFAPEAYNYNTTNDDDPRNLILLCTTQGVAVQQDGSGAKKLYHHAKVDGEVRRYWLEAESTDHKVGGSQQETKEEKEDAVRRGKATSSVIGVKGMGTRFNILMTVQVPLEQQNRKMRSNYLFGDDDEWAEIEEYEECEEECEDMAFGLFSMNETKVRRMKKEDQTFGKSSAARVSRGSQVDETPWNGLTVTNPKRHPNEHVTATIVMYYTCSGGVPTMEDVKAAVDDLEEMYRSIENGNLREKTFDFMKSELTYKDMKYVENKVGAQPAPKPELPVNANVFPS